MSSNYIEIFNDSEINGTLAIEKSVVRDIAKHTILENGKVSINTKLMQNKGVSVLYEDGQLTVNLDVDVKYGNHVIGVIENVQNKIFQAITTSTGIQDVIINVWVVGFTF